MESSGADPRPEEPAVADVPEKEKREALELAREVQTVGPSTTPLFQKIERLPVDEQLTARDRFENTRLKRLYARWLLILLTVQILVANWLFYRYGEERGWGIPASVVQVWLGATVVQIVGIVGIVTKYLFHREGN